MYYIIFLLDIMFYPIKYPFYQAVFSCEFSYNASGCFQDVLVQETYKKKFVFNSSVKQVETSNTLVLKVR